jgi:hypothetical protein
MSVNRTRKQRSKYHDTYLRIFLIETPIVDSMKNVNEQTQIILPIMQVLNSYFLYTLVDTVDRESVIIYCMLAFTNILVYLHTRTEIIDHKFVSVSYITDLF